MQHHKERDQDDSSSSLLSPISQTSFLSFYSAFVYYSFVKILLVLLLLCFLSIKFLNIICSVKICELNKKNSILNCQKIIFYLKCSYNINTKYFVILKVNIWIANLLKSLKGIKTFINKQQCLVWDLKKSFPSIQHVYNTQNNQFSTQFS